MDWHAGVTACPCGRRNLGPTAYDFSYVLQCHRHRPDFGASPKRVSVSVNWFAGTPGLYGHRPTDRTIALGSMLSFDTAEVYGHSIPQLSVTARQNGVELSTAMTAPRSHPLQLSRSASDPFPGAPVRARLDANRKPKGWAHAAGIPLHTMSG